MPISQKKKNEFFVLKENRRQEKNLAFGHIWDSIKKGGGILFSNSNSEQHKGDVKEDVKTFFRNAFVRDWNISGDNAHLEKGVLISSYRKYCDRWCDAVVKHMDRRFLDRDKINIYSYYDSPQGETQYDERNTNLHHQQNKQQYPQILKLRTHPEHQCRLMLLRNEDKTLTNGTLFRLLPENSWNECNRGDAKGRCDENGNWKVQTLSLQKQKDFQILVNQGTTRRTES